MTIRKKIIGGSLAVGLAIFGGALLLITWIDSGMTPLGQLHVPALIKIQFIEATLKDVVQESLSYLVSGDVAKKKEFLELTKRFDQEVEKFIEIAHFHEPKEENEASLFNKIRGQQKLLVEQANVLFREYESQGSISHANFLAYDQIIEELTLDVEALVRFEKLETDEAKDLFISLTSQTKWSLYFLALLAIIGASAGGFILAKNIANRIDALKTAAVAIEGGAFDTRINFEGDDELDALGKAVNDMAESLRAKFLTEREFATVMEANHRMRREITERKNAEEAFSASEEQYRTLVEFSPYCIHQLDTDATFRSINRSGLQMLGLQDETEVYKKPYLDLVMKGDKDRIGGLFNLALKGKSSEFEFEGPDGRIFQSTLVPIKYSGKNVDVIMGITQEITKRRQVEDSFQRLVQGTASVTGGAFFDTFIEHLALAAGVRFALVTELATEDGSRLRSLSSWHRALNQQPFEYKIEGTPCQVVLLDGSAYYPNHVSELFPGDKELIEIEAESYLGLALQGKDGNPIGHICVIHDAPLPNYDHIKNVISIFGARAAVELERMKAEINATQALEKAHSLARQLLSAQEEERKRIARDLHDEFGQVLTGLKFDLVQLNKHLEPASPSHSVATFHNQLSSMAKTVDTAIHTMRRIATDLRPSILDDLGLDAALEWHVQDFQTRTSIPSTLTVSENVSGLVLDPNCALTLFRITQELLTNVFKHARASKVAIILTYVADSILLEVKDDGRGMTQQEIDQTTSLGLNGIRERLSILSGKLTIHSEAGKGTKIAICIPWIPLPTHQVETHHA